MAGFQRQTVHGVAEGLGIVKGLAITKDRRGRGEVALGVQKT